MSPPPTPVPLDEQAYLTAVQYLRETCIYTVSVGPAQTELWSNARRRVAAGSDGPAPMASLRHVSTVRTENPEYEEYAITLAAKAHEDHPQITEYGEELAEAWQRPDTDPERDRAVRDCYNRLADLVDRYIHGIPSVIRIDKGLDELTETEQQELLGRVMELAEQTWAMRGDPVPGAE